MTLLENVNNEYFIETNKQNHVHPTDNNNNQFIKDYQFNLNDYSSLIDYQNDVLQLACYYEQILKRYGKIELEALAYRVSAAYHSCESPNKFNSINFNSPTKFRSKNDISYDCPYNTETFVASFHPPITYHLEVQLTSSKSIYFNQLPSQPMNCLPNVNHHFNSSFMNRLSCKVFVGGVPMRGNQVTTWTRDQLHKGLSIFGPLSLIWPKGYCYAVFNDQRSVTLLLSMCYRRTKGFYINLSTLYPDLEKTRFDSLQIIPWDKQDSFYPFICNRNSENINFQSEEGRTEIETRTKVYSIFVGALHGMITARALFTIFNDLFGNVSYAALDTDKYHYPIGSGRVAFNSPQGYLAAITTNFICIECQLFSKVIQIDPYLEDAICSKCYSAPGIYFCRHLKCFDYFCPKCWINYHGSSNTTHKPLRRTLSPNSLKFPKHF
uniref:Cytoplasmic polyadenylation element-binding protein 1 n=1 Tax=Schistosoma haematobium TaxID=6185 RepID=A0A095B036_SCHHA